MLKIPTFHARQSNLNTIREILFYFEDNNFFFTFLIFYYEKLHFVLIYLDNKNNTWGIFLCFFIHNIMNFIFNINFYLYLILFFGIFSNVYL